MSQLTGTSISKVKALWALAVAVAIGAVMTVAAMGASAAPAYAADYQAGTLATTAANSLAKGTTFKAGGNTYRITDYDAYDDNPGEVVLVKYGSTKTAVTVNTVKYQGEIFEVEAIGKNAFNNAQGHKVKSVKIGRNVDVIRTKAFYGCKKLAKLNMAQSDVIDIDRNRAGCYIDDIDVGAQAFKGAGTAKLKVNCGSKNANYQALYKKALVKKGMRSDVTIVK